MKQSFIILAIISAMFFFTSCEKVTGEGPVVTETRAVQGFKGVSLSVGGTVNYTIAPAYKVELAAQRNILDVIETKLTGNELLIKFKNGTHVKSHDDIVINISAPSAEFINMDGSSDLILAGTVTTSNLSLGLSGSGSIDANKVVVSDKLSANISGSGSIKLRDGSADNTSLKISGSGKMDFSGVVVKKSITDISGSGDMRVNVSQTLDATISGSGSVYYLGVPQISTHISGSGSVKPL